MKILKNLIYIILIIISSIMFGFVFYLCLYFNTTTFEQLLYNLINMDCLNIVSVNKSLYSVILFSVLFLVLFSVPLLMGLFIDKKWIITKGDKKIQLFPINIRKFSGFLVVTGLVLLLIAVDFFPFIVKKTAKSSLYEDYYVEYADDKVFFPSDKQNLIMIYVESFENSVFSRDNGGTVDDGSYAPRLEKMAMNEKYINFSNGDDIGGFRQVNGTNWTVAALVGQTAGVPIYIQTKSKNDIFFEGAISIGEILENNGYNNVFMLGSDARFAERNKYFSTHGNYYVYDYTEARYNGDIPFSYFEWWGYEDNKLYENAKIELSKLAKRDGPFNFTLLTADTHYFDGYTDESCPKKFKEAYANSYYCTDIMLTEFLDWIMEQDFYQNTTVIVVGDHLTMRDDFFKTSKNYDRTVFNLFLNSRVSTDNIKNRDFVTFDMFPTTLAALGVTIEGDRIALGTNLFSDRKTLVEELGYEEFTKELGKKSEYYDKEILKKKN